MRGGMPRTSGGRGGVPGTPGTRGPGSDGGMPDAGGGTGAPVMPGTLPGRIGSCRPPGSGIEGKERRRAGKNRGNSGSRVRTRSPRSPGIGI